MAVDIFIGGTYPFLDGAVEPLNIWYVFAFVESVEPNMQESQCTTV